MCLKVDAIYRNHDVLGKLLDLWWSTIEHSGTVKKSKVPGECQPDPNGISNCGSPSMRTTAEGPSSITTTKFDGEKQAGYLKAELTNGRKGDCKRWSSNLAAVGGLAGPTAPFFSVL
ncbi:hypothetical protein QQS21_001710 [Conoideocrella luteorostrata]|uniref:Uncharacterized protein n=1 Tax=Conoideocrella luteorostrata TaxID=1105319 RepID=A0AAJ0G1V7_9HYPO|nr:hypothetical protein QQS21_001710 [Conoideocrella luteorostrata]